PGEQRFNDVVARLAAERYVWEYVSPPRSVIASPDPTASIQRLVPPEPGPSNRRPVVHLNAPWIERVDDEIAMRARLDEERTRIEMMPARRLGGATWELCAAPFLIDDLAMGDIVEADADMFLVRVLKRSG